jgi:hypothetical protein
MSGNRVQMPTPWQGEREVVMTIGYTRYHQGGIYEGN